MKSEFYLSPKGRQDVSVTGQYIGYVSGAGEIEVNVNGEHHYLNVNEVLQVNGGFNSFTVTNMADFAGEFVIKAGMGRLIMAGDGQLTDVLRIRETVKSNVLNHDDISAPIVTALAQALTANVGNATDISNPIVTALAQTLTANVGNATAISNPIVAALAKTLTANIANAGDISNPVVAALAQKLTAKISGLVSTQEKAATSLAASEKTFTAGESFTIPANTNRRDITVMASETNTDVVTVAGIPLRAGQYVGLENYTGAVTAQAAAADQIFITEVIK